MSYMKHEWHQRQATSTPPSSDHIDAIRSLFLGRQDVYAVRFQGKDRAGYMPKRVKGESCPLTDQAIQQHLLGSETVGIYPMLDGDACQFLAVDFDDTNWEREATQFRSACRARNIPAYMEISRSGNGAHVWIFFTAPVSAAKARCMGKQLLGQVGNLQAYDRMFPAQDQLKAGGIGNLIALPFQAVPSKSGYSVFVDDACLPFVDQWKFLSSIRRMTPQDLEEFLMPTEKPKKNSAAVSLGRRGGIARAANNTAEQLSAIGKHASLARWGNSEKCPCGQMTVNRAAARNHKCQPT